MMAKEIRMKNGARRAFTLIELLVVIAIISILAAILFPVFGAVREQARQSSTMSSLYSAYVGARLYYEDEGRFPTTLFGYAEAADNTVSPPYRPITVGDSSPLVPMDQFHGVFRIQKGTPNESVFKGYTYANQVKDRTTFLNSVNAAVSPTDAVIAYYPVNSPLGAGSSIDANGVLQNGVPVTWVGPGHKDSRGYDIASDPELPNSAYDGVSKVYYSLDSLDIGPMLAKDGSQVHDPSGKIVYELHYSPDWSKLTGVTADTANPQVTQLKYKNPPPDRTVLTYVTHHSAYSRRGTIIVMLMNGTARKISATQAFNQLPLGYN